MHMFTSSCFFDQNGLRYAFRRGVIEIPFLYRWRTRDADIRQNSAQFGAKIGPKSSPDGFKIDTHARIF